MRSRGEGADGVMMRGRVEGRQRGKVYKRMKRR